MRTIRVVTGRAVVLAMMVVIAGVVPIGAQSSGQALGTVRLGRAVVADGQPLAAGTYTVRLSGDAVTPVVGQGPTSEHWVEFVQGGKVKGRELASVVPPSDVKQVAKTAPPTAGRAKVQMLKGAEYLRVWLNQSGTQYLLHLGLAKR